MWQAARGRSDGSYHVQLEDYLKDLPRERCRSLSLIQLQKVRKKFPKDNAYASDHGTFSLIKDSSRVGNHGCHTQGHNTLESRMTKDVFNKVSGIAD